MFFPIMKMSRNSLSSVTFKKVITAKTPPNSKNLIPNNPTRSKSDYTTKALKKIKNQDLNEHNSNNFTFQINIKPEIKRSRVTELIETQSNYSSKSMINQFRPINEIIDKVIKWRCMCYDEFVPNTEKVLSKEGAAKMLNIKKKSFDDYQMFLRLGIAANFDFKSNLFNSFNVLRKYVKSITPRIHWDKEIHDDIETLATLL